MGKFHRISERNLRDTLQRQGVIVVEFLLVFPILLIFLAGVIEFALILGATQQVAQASRLGAKYAASTPNLGDNIGFPSATADAAAMIRTKVDRLFLAANFGANASEGVRLRHTINGGNTAAVGVAPDPLVPAIPDNSVRVSVSIGLSKVTPNLLQSFGFDTTNKTLELFTTYGYEL